MVNLIAFVTFALGFSYAANAAPHKRAADELIARVGAIGTAIEHFDQLVSSIPSSNATLEDVMIAYYYSGAVLEAFDVATTVAISTGKQTEEDGQTIYELSKQTLPVGVQLCSHASEKRNAVAAFQGVVEAIHDYLVMLQGFTRAYAEAILSNCPSSLVEPHRNLAQALDAALSATIKAYEPLSS